MVRSLHTYSTFAFSSDARVSLPFPPPPNYINPSTTAEGPFRLIHIQCDSEFAFSLEAQSRAFNPFSPAPRWLARGASHVPLRIYTHSCVPPSGFSHSTSCGSNVQQKCCPYLAGRRSFLPCCRL